MAGRFPPGAFVVATERQLSTTLGDEVIILGLDDSKYYGLTSVGVRIWELLKSPRTIADILSVITDEYDVDRQRAAADVDALLADLESRGLVAISQPRADR
jgi:hypothetical protein